MCLILSAALCLGKSVMSSQACSATCNVIYTPSCLILSAEVCLVKSVMLTVPSCRASVAPFLAANEMGLDSFKWVLYGDDDTVFFIDGALKMLENLDHNMPYLLSDDVWFVEDDGMLFFLLPAAMSSVSDTA